MIPLPLYAGMDDEFIAIINDEIAREDSIEWIFAPVEVDESQLAFDLFPYDEEAQDLEDDMADRDFWAKGQW